MKNPIAVGASVLVLGLTACGSLLAQPAPVYPGVYPAPYPSAFPALPPFEIVAIVRSKGFEPLSRPARQGPTYWVRAADPSGREMQVIVDARAGRIVRVIPANRVGGLSPPYPVPAGRTVPDGNGPSSRVGNYADAPDRTMPEERSLPAAGPTGLPATPPLASQRAVSARAPLPRPRPSIPSLSASAEDPVPALSAPNQAPAVQEIDE